MGKQYGHLILEKVLAMKEEGKTHKEIGEEFGYTKVQIKKLIERYNKNQRKANAGIALKKRGRPPKGYVVSKKDKVTELRYILNRKDYRIK